MIWQDGVGNISVQSATIPANYKAAAVATVDLHPIQNTQPTQSNMFGPTIANLARSYVRYRLRSLQVHFDSVRPTLDTGGLAIGYVEDPLTGVSNTYQQIVNTDGSIAFPVWGQSQVLRVAFLKNREWRYTQVPHADSSAPVPSPADQRQTFDGSLVINQLGLTPGTTVLGAPVNQLLGSLSFKGVIEFFELSTLNTESVTGITNQLSSSSLSDPLPFLHQTANSMNISASTLSPFGSLTDITTTGFGNDITRPDQKSLVFTRTGVYSIQISWLSSTGASGLSSPPSVTLAGGIGVTISQTYTPATPWPVDFHYAVDVSSGPVTLVFTGPTSMTSGSMELLVSLLP
jgi:hypothetical protein